MIMLSSWEWSLQLVVNDRSSPQLFQLGTSSFGVTRLSAHTTRPPLPLPTPYFPPTTSPWLTSPTTSRTLSFVLTPLKESTLVVPGFWASIKQFPLVGTVSLHCSLYSFHTTVTGNTRTALCTRSVRLCTVWVVWASGVWGWRLWVSGGVGVRCSSVWWLIGPQKEVTTSLTSATLVELPP